MNSGHGGSFERLTASTFHLYTSPDFVITGAPREPARPLFIFTLRGGSRVTEKLHARAVRSHLESSSRAPPRPWRFAAMSSLRSDSLDSGVTAASGDVGGEVHEICPKGWDLIDLQEARRAASQNPDLVGRTPRLASATAGSEKSGQGQFRTPQAPHCERDDVGWMSVYQGNWGGKRTNKQLAQHIITDVIKENPCHIVVAQEVDQDTEQVMRDVINPEGRPPLYAPAMAGQASSPSAASYTAASATAELASSSAASATAVQPMWIVAVGVEEGNAKTNLVAARSTFATDVKILEWHKTTDGTYKAKTKGKTKLNAISRVLVVEVTLKQPWSGRTTVTIANVHLHHMTAKVESGFKEGSQKWWAGFRALIGRWDIDIVAGDFNMALWNVVPSLRKERVVTLMSAYAWLSGTAKSIHEDDEESGDSDVTVDPASASAEPKRASATAEPATASADARKEPSRRYTEEELKAMTPPPEVRSDSCGIFLIKSADDVKRILTVESFLRGSRLEMHPKGQGYPYKSYRGGVEAVRETFLHSQEAFATTRDRGVVRDVRETLWPPVKERPVSFGNFDPNNLLFRSGAHAPLMIWIGKMGRRSADRLQIREQRAIERGWGPGSENRARSMQREGKGPRPKSCTRESGDDRTRNGGAAP